MAKDVISYILKTSLFSGRRPLRLRYELGLAKVYRDPVRSYFEVHSSFANDKTRALSLHSKQSVQRNTTQSVILRKSQNASAMPAISHAKKKPLVLEVTSLRRYHDRTANTVFCLPFLLPKQSIVRQISTSSARQYPSKSFFTPEAQSHIHCRSETLRAAILDPANPSGLFELRSIISSSFYDKPTAVPRTFHIQTPSFVLRMQYPRNNHCV
jgi:hypothetical protein